MLKTSTTTAIAVIHCCGAFLNMKIKVNDLNIKEVVRIEVERQNKLIQLNVVDIEEINLNHIDVSDVTNMSELFKDFIFLKPLNIENWGLDNITNCINFWEGRSIAINPDIWRG